jgi:pimeloyl-ACP methyl ester carboxylesterase
VRLPLVLLLALAACATAPPPFPSAGRMIALRFDPADPASATLSARVCAPPDAGRVRYPVALINHGSPGPGEDPADMQPAACASPAMRWFTMHGYVAVALMRRGFGRSDGPVRENVGACVSPDYAGSAETGAQDIAAGLRGAFALDIAEPKDALVVGQSTGGWAALAYAGQADPRVKAAIVFAPGRGGRAYPPPDSVCRPDLLRQAAAQFGARSRLPVLWIAAENDSFFPPDIAASLHDAFIDAGGQAQMVMIPPFFDEGHALFAAPGGVDVWGGAVENFLQRLPPG